MSQSNARRHLASTIILIVSVAVAYLLISNRQFVLDQVSLLQYTAPQDIAQMAERTTMTDLGQRTFFASQPSLEEAQTFRSICGNNEQGTAVLGCYNNRRIHIFNVTDQQLDGIRDVTAAHEMLHGVYDRMTDGERAALTPLLEAEYQTLTKDSAFADRMAYYAKVEPGERDNELHSIIGTEVRNVSPELEAHYKKYFHDRAAVVTLHDKYSSVFNRLKTESDELVNRLNVLATSIEQATAAYNTASRQLNRDISDFNRRAANGDFTSQSSFNSERSALALRSEKLAGDRQSINNMISEYNQLRDRLAALATQTEALNRSIDSSLEPAPQL